MQEVKAGLERKKSFLYQLLNESWQFINDPNSKSYILMLLSGTNALQLYDEFLTSNYKYFPINLPLLEASHLLEIIQSNSPLFSIDISRHFGEQGSFCATTRALFLSVGCCWTSTIIQSSYFCCFLAQGTPTYNNELDQRHCWSRPVSVIQSGRFFCFFSWQSLQSRTVDCISKYLERYFDKPIS